MNNEGSFETGLYVRWLRVLMYIAAASLVNSFVSYVPFVPAALTTWISRGIMAATVICMFRLGHANARYTEAGILRAGMLACALITAFLFGSLILTVAASVLSILAVYQEYTAHGERMADVDAKLSGKWRRLFLWSILSVVLLSAGSSLVAVILVAAEPAADVSQISGIAIGLLRIPKTVVEVVYLVYIRKMISVFENGEVA